MEIDIDRLQRADDFNRAFEMVWLPFAREMNERLYYLWQALEPLHRAMTYQVLRRKGLPHGIASVLSNRLPRHWLPPMDLLYRELNHF